jgi:transposase
MPRRGQDSPAVDTSVVHPVCTQPHECVDCPTRRPNLSRLSWLVALSSSLKRLASVAGVLRVWTGRMGFMPKKYEAEFKARVVRMVVDQVPHFPTKTAACEAVAKREGIGRETLRKWVSQHEVDVGARPGVSSVELEEVAALRRENKRLREQVEVLSAATSFFVGVLDSRKR